MLVARTQLLSLGPSPRFPTPYHAQAKTQDLADGLGNDGACAHRIGDVLLAESKLSAEGNQSAEPEGDLHAPQADHY